MSDNKTETDKLTFLALASTTFDNNMECVRNDNCIKFYHFLLDSLQFQCKDAFETQNEEKYFLYDSIVELFEKFNTMHEKDISLLIKDEKYLLIYLQEKSLLFEDEVRKGLRELRAFFDSLVEVFAYR